jgi:hypothetical protein
MRLQISAIALAVAAALPSLAAAVDFSYSGFSTGGYAQTDEDRAQVGFSGQPEGIDSDGSFEADSKLGLQATARFNDMFSATVQGVAYADLTSEWEPRLDWAYVRFQPLSSLSARAGYLRAPVFMYSDSVFIGYANSWVRTPYDVYRLSPVYQLRGVDVVWRETFGKATVTLQPYFGDSEVEAGADKTTIEVKEWYGAVASVELGSLMLRAGYSKIRLPSDAHNVQLDPAIAALRSMVPRGCTGCAIDADRMDMAGLQMNLFSAGVQYDDGSNLVIAEYADRSTGSIVTNDLYAAYATYGHRFGPLMPYGTYSITRRNGVESSAIPAGSPFAALAGVVNNVLSATTNDQSTYGFGVRYEVPAFSVLKGAIAKLQYDHFDAKAGNGTFINVQPGFDGDADMISASFDLIF